MAAPGRKVPWLTVTKPTKQKPECGLDATAQAPCIGGWSVAYRPGTGSFIVGLATAT